MASELSHKSDDTQTQSTNIEDVMVKNVYHQIAHHFKDTRAYSWDWITKFVNSFPKDSMIYDIGCGSGRNMNYSGYNFIGIDNCSEFLSICRKNGQKAMYANMTSIPLDDASCDGIMCVAAFHHLSSVERRIKALQEMKRLVKPGGKILISVWSKEQPEKTRRKFDHYGHNIVPWKQHDGTYIDRYYHIFQIEELEGLFKYVGLSIVHHEWNVGNEVYILTKDTT